MCDNSAAVMFMKYVYVYFQCSLVSEVVIILYSIYSHTYF